MLTPVYRRPALSSMAAGGMRSRAEGLFLQRGDMGAVTAPHQNAVLRVAKVRQLHRKPYAGAGQKRGKQKCCNVCYHPMAIVVRARPVSLQRRRSVTGDAAFRRPVHSSRSTGWIRRRPWAKSDYSLFAVSQVGAVNCHAGNPKNTLRVCLTLRLNVSRENTRFQPCTKD